MNTIEKLNLQYRVGNYMPGDTEWLWPAEDSHCWEYFNYSESRYFSDKKIKGYHLPNEIIPLLENKNLVIQAGGNSGLYPYIYSQHFKNVLTFEPDYRWFYCLSVNVRADNVFKFQCAIGNDNIPVSTNIPLLKGTENLGGIFVKNGGNIPKIKIDSLGLAPNLIHLDIEGGEWEALLGASETIKKSKPLIVVEWDEITMHRVGWDTKKVYEMFSDFNYFLVKEWNRDKAFAYKEI